MLFWVFGKKNAQLGHYNHFHTVYKSPPRHDEDYIYKSPHTYINISITNMTSLTNLFSLVFAFLQTALNFSSILSILFISSSVNFLAKFVRNFMQTGRNRTTTTKHHYDIKGMSFQKIFMTPFTKRVLEQTLPTPTPLSYPSENWVIPEKICTPPRRMGSFFNPPSHLDFLKHKTPILSGFPRQKTPPPAWISGKNYSA